MTQSGAAAILAMKPGIYGLLKQTYYKYCNLWDNEMDAMINEFVLSNPLTGEIRDKFNVYDMQTQEVLDVTKSVRVDCIDILFNDFFDECVVHAKAWKITMGKHLTAMYRKKLMIFVDFISEMSKILKKTLKDLDDVRIAMDALEKIRQESAT